MFLADLVVVWPAAEDGDDGEGDKGQGRPYPNQDTQNRRHGELSPQGSDLSLDR